MTNLQKRLSAVSFAVTLFFLVPVNPYRELNAWLNVVLLLVGLYSGLYMMFDFGFREIVAILASVWTWLQPHVLFLWSIVKAPVKAWRER